MIGLTNSYYQGEGDCRNFVFKIATDFVLWINGACISYKINIYFRENIQKSKTYGWNLKKTTTFGHVRIIPILLTYWGKCNSTI